MMPSTWLLDTHLDDHASATAAFRSQARRLAVWGRHLASILGYGGRLLTAGNGGSAAQAQHLAAELVGKLDADRRALSAIALSADTSALTAIGNDYGYPEVFARQVRAHARPGDVVLLLSTSGRSPNVLAAADAAREMGVTAWAMTGPAPNPLARRCQDVLAVPSGSNQVVQELHLLAVHVLCGYVDAALPDLAGDHDGHRDRGGHHGYDGYHGLDGLNGHDGHRRVEMAPATLAPYRTGATGERAGRGARRQHGGRP